MSDLPNTVVQVISAHLVIEGSEKHDNIPSNAEDFEGKTSSGDAKDDTRNNQVAQKNKDEKHVTKSGLVTSVRIRRTSFVIFQLPITVYVRRQMPIQS